MPLLYSWEFASRKGGSGGSGGSEVTGLRFPTNGDSPTATIVAFRFTGANAPSPFPATYIWRVKYRQQVIGSGGRYHTLFFWGDTTLTGFVAQGYYGFHPYPDPAPNGVPAVWEISTDGRDITGPAVSYGQTYTQAAVVELVNTDELQTTFYYNLPNTASVLTDTTASNWASTFPNGAAPGIVVGEAPWSVDSERLSGTLGPFKMFSAALSQADILSEAADMSQIVTSAGNSNRWWFKPSFASVDDLTDAVTGKSAAWYNSNKASLELFT